MTIVPVGAVGAVGSLAPTAQAAPAPGFGEMLQNGLDQVSSAENRADGLITRLAAGDDVAIHEVMIAAAEAELAVEMLVAVRDQAVQAYQQIMNMQV